MLLAVLVMGGVSLARPDHARLGRSVVGVRPNIAG